MRRTITAYSLPLVIIAAALFVLSFVVPRDLAPIFFITGIVVFVMFGVLLWIGLVKRLRSLRDSRR